LCEAPEGPFRQKVPVTFSAATIVRLFWQTRRLVALNPPFPVRRNTIAPVAMALLLRATTRRHDSFLQTTKGW
jgi:hypothetical protein